MKLNKRSKNKIVMNEKIFEILEYNKIRQMLEKFATSEPGREICRSIGVVS